MVLPLYKSCHPVAKSNDESSTSRDTEDPMSSYGIFLSKNYRLVVIYCILYCFEMRNNQLILLSVSFPLRMCQVRGRSLIDYFRSSYDVVK